MTLGDSSMPDIRVLLFLAAWAPGAVLAQAAEPGPLLAPPLVAAPEEPAFTPGPPLEAVEVPRPEVRPYSVSPARVSVEVLGGAGGGFLATLATLIVANASDVDRLSCRGDVCDGHLLGALAIAGCGLGSTAAVYASGELMGGQGRLLPTLLSGLALGGAGAGLYYAGVGESAEVVIPIMALPMVSSVIAYELSGALSVSRPHSLAEPSASGVTWAPSFTVSPKGSTFGLIGRF
jgi:hypothetical protein